MLGNVILFVLKLFGLDGVFPLLFLQLFPGLNFMLPLIVADPRGVRQQLSQGDTALVLRPHIFAKIL